MNSHAFPCKSIMHVFTSSVSKFHDQISARGPKRPSGSRVLFVTSDRSFQERFFCLFVTFHRACAHMLHNFFNLSRVERMYAASPFDGGTPCPLPRGDLPPHVFLPRSRSSDPTGRGRRGTARKQQHNNNDTMMSCRGSRAIIAPREVRLILSGIPLSLIYP